MHLIPTLCLALLPQQDVQEPAGQSAGEPAPEAQEIAEACQALEAMGSYTFQQTLKESGGGPDGSRAGGEGAMASEPQLITLQGHVQEETPLHLRLGDLEAWRNGRVLVHREGQGGWQRFEAKPGWHEGKPRGRRDPGKPDDASAPAPVDEEKRRRMRVLHTMSKVGMPHEAVKALAKDAPKITKHEEGERTVYSGILSEAGAAAFVAGRPEAYGRDRQPKVAGKPAKSEGTFQIVVDQDGTLNSASVDARVSGNVGNRSVERSRSLEIVLSDVGSTEIALPEEARSLLESPEEDREGDA